MPPEENKPDGGEPSSETGSLPPGQFYRAAWFFYLALAIVGILWVGFASGDIRLALFLDTELWWQDLLIGIGAGFALIGGWWALREHLESMRRVESFMKEVIGDLEGSEIIALALMSGFAEELLFRGAMQGSWGWPVALLIFTLLHTGPEKAFRIWTLFALVAGGLFAWLTILRGNLLPAIVAHVVVNGVNLRRLMHQEIQQGTSD